MQPDQFGKNNSHNRFSALLVSLLAKHELRKFKFKHFVLVYLKTDQLVVLETETYHFV